MRFTIDDKQLTKWVWVKTKISNRQTTRRTNTRAVQSWSWVTFSIPNPTQNFWTQPNPQKSVPDPTQPIIDTWYGILGYTENFIQQVLHVTDKFTVRS